MRGLRILRAGGRNGGAVFVQAGGRADFTDVGFESEYVQRDLSAEPSAAARRRVVNADRPLSEAAIEAARAAVAGTTGLDHVRVTEPYNTTFTRCNFTENVVRSRRGAVAARVVARMGHLRRVSLRRKRRRDQGRDRARRRGARRGTAASSSPRARSRRTSRRTPAARRSRGGLFGGVISPPTPPRRVRRRDLRAERHRDAPGLLVQETLFARNVAEREGGAVFVYGPGAATFRGCEFDSTPSSAPDPPSATGDLPGPRARRGRTRGRRTTAPTRRRAWRERRRRSGYTDPRTSRSPNRGTPRRCTSDRRRRRRRRRRRAAAAAAAAGTGTGTSVPPPPPPPPPPMDSAGTPPPPPASSSGGSSSPGGYAY